MGKSLRVGILRYCARIYEVCGWTEQSWEVFRLQVGILRYCAVMYVAGLSKVGKTLVCGSVF